MPTVLKNTVIGKLKKTNFNKLPAAVQEDFLSSVCVESEKNGVFHFTIQSHSDAHRLSTRIHDVERNRQSAKIRKERLDRDSPGHHTDSDIEELFILQDGRCYYTGNKLNWNPRDFAIDHIVPIASGGSSWPINLALCKKRINIQKRNLSKRKFFENLKSDFGGEWYSDHLFFVKDVDRRRKHLDQRRKKQTALDMNGLVESAQSEFPFVDLEYELVDGVPVLKVGLVTIQFSAGFVRQRKKFNSDRYLREIVRAVVDGDAG